MTPPELANLYRAYIACLNARDWLELGRLKSKEDRFIYWPAHHQPEK
ncbi:hypothetical protein NAV26_01160 [Pseudomonas stutzeri]|nr:MULTISPECIES: hypothetical protein [Pseudomonadaceae]MCQ4323572.1 hypothetical protein [Stutzerimonas stutzeri]